MPQIGSRDMSWLSPKRRRTTGNLQTLSNGQAANDGAGSPSNVGTPRKERPPSRPQSMTLSSNAVPRPSSSDDNLFYAYARRGDDLRSRYLLTFASAATASEWWELVQEHYPDATRPGVQLFSFKQDDLLGKAWKHDAFEHLRTKWMFITFGDAGNVGGAAQGIIPVQDSDGNMIGGGSPAASPQIGQIKQEAKQVKQETGAVKKEVVRLEEHFERMMEAVERNTEQIAVLAEKQNARMESRLDSPFQEKATGGSDSQNGGYFDSSEASSHLGRISDLLQSNTDHVEALAKRQLENEEKLREALEASTKKEQSDSLNLSQLSSHLDRIQKLMEQSAQERKDSAKELPTSQPQIDFSPLTDRLEKVQQAVQQNSALVKALLDEGTNASAPGTPWEKQQPNFDLSPMNAQLERIHDAIQFQSNHMRALVDFATGDGGGATPGSESAPVQHASLAPLSEHLEQIYHIIEEGNHAAQYKEIDLSPLSEDIQNLQAVIEDGQNAARERHYDILPIRTYLEAIQASTGQTAEHLGQLVDAQDDLREAVSGELDFTPLADHFDAMQRATEENSEYLKALLDSRPTNGTSAPASEIDLTPLTEHLSSIHASLEKQHQAAREQSPGTGDGKFLINALTSHLSKIQAVTEANAQHVKALREKHSASQDKMHVAVSETAEQVKTLVERQESQNASGQNNDTQMQELMASVKDLTKAILAGKCDHVVSAPPRKTGRKVVGFVYDGKDDDNGPKTPKSIMKKTSGTV